jgi:hypothetical protein
MMRSRYFTIYEVLVNNRRPRIRDIIRERDVVDGSYAERTQVTTSPES